MNNESFTNYLSWLGERGLIDIPPIYTTRFKNANTADHPSSNVPFPERQAKSSKRPPLVDLSDTQNMPSTPTTIESISIDNVAHKTLLLFDEIPEGPHLHLLTKIMKALKLGDGHFNVILWEKTDPGLFWDSEELPLCKSIFCFSQTIAELLLDDDFDSIAYQWVPSIAKVPFLSANTLKTIMNSAYDKSLLWKSIKAYLDISK